MKNIANLKTTEDNETYYEDDGDDLVYVEYKI